MWYKCSHWPLERLIFLNSLDGRHAHLVIDRIYGVLCILDKQSTQEMCQQTTNSQILENCCLVQIRDLDYRFISARNRLFEDLKSILYDLLSHTLFLTFQERESHRDPFFFFLFLILNTVIIQQWNGTQCEGVVLLWLLLLDFHAMQEGKIKWSLSTRKHEVTQLLIGFTTPCVRF